MRVIVPYTIAGEPGVERGLHATCEQALSRFAPDAEMIYLGTRPDAYHDLLEELWAAGQSFLLIEHDIEIHQHVLTEAEACPEPYCSWPYGIGYPADPVTVALGCTRFSAEIIDAVPDLMSMLPVRDWRRQDCEIAPRLKAAGFEPHVHDPPVLHHHAYPAPGGERCACGAEH